MTRLPFKTRFWKRKLENEQPALSISGTLARRVFYAGVFFYASFFAHGYFVYDGRAAAADASASAGVAPVTTLADQPALERGLAQPVLDRVLGRRS